MKAKDLLTKVSEAGESFGPKRSPSAPPLPPLARSSRQTGSPRLDPRDPTGGIDPDADIVARAMGGREEPKGQFSQQETSQLKDVMILLLANLVQSDLDKQIGQALMTGQELDPGQLQHILDEARQLDIPQTHGALLQKIFTKLSSR